MWKNRNKLLIFLLWIMEIRLVSSFTSRILCSHIPGLTSQQQQLCSESPDALIALSEGVHQMGSHECQHQFRGHRWNCSQVWQKDVFAHVMLVGSPEAAFTYAIASAGAAYAVTAACARGNISLCGCDMRHKPTNWRRASPVTLDDSGAQSWKWGGCSADVDFGMKFARKFLDSREIEGDARSLMNVHNNRVGRRLVKNLLRTECKCHGVSGSCGMKTCWRSLPPFRQIGEVLMRKYNKAKLVHADKGENGLKLVLSKTSRKHRFVNPKRMELESSRKHSYGDPKRMELVYLQESPDYCERNLKLGVLGTTGRVCNRTSAGPQRCDLLCCERGYNTRQIRRRTQCRCQFRWCCDVTCDVCEENYEEFTCK